MKRKIILAYSSPITIWLTVLFLIPTLIVLVYSFLEKGMYGGVSWVFSIEAYKSFNSPYFIKVLWNTISISIIVTFITILIAIPTALFIATSKRKNLLLFLIIIPFWTNFLIRIYSWIGILGNNGFLNNFLIAIRNFLLNVASKEGIMSPLFSFFGNLLVDAPYQFLYNKSAVVIVSIYAYLPYAILPLYSTIEKFDFSLIDAARDLGANKVQAYLKIFLPNIKAGIITAGLFTFIPALGSYAIPQLVGGIDSHMLGNIIATELTITRNWPKAAAISTALIGITSILIIVFSKYDKEHKAN